MEAAIRQTPPMPEHPRPIIAIGAGGIVRDAHQPAYQKAKFPVYGVFDRNPDAARELADTFQIPRVFTSLADATEQAPAEAVYDIAVPASALPELVPQLPDGAHALI